MRYTFVDEVTIDARSGNGGSGCVAFRREKYIPYGGPNGGDGGKGGDVILRVDPQMATLLDYRFKPRQHAGHGQGGMGSQCTGHDGAECEVRVPRGTVIYNADTGEELADLSGSEGTFVVARGGRGGKGNEHFKTSVRQAPNFAQPGEPGEHISIRLELKLLADVGLIGLPNVGKSSLIARISASKPKIADYPFTTLVPNLGVVQFGESQHYVVADVPGLIVGAHTGAGLGSRFLRHVERVRCIVHMVTAPLDADPEDASAGPLVDFAAIEREMTLHNADLAKTARVLVLNRIDLPEVAAFIPQVMAFAKAQGLAFFPISAATGAGLPALLSHLGHLVTQQRIADAEKASPANPTLPLGAALQHAEVA